MWVLKVALILTFIFIFYQDYKSRLVYWFLYPAIGILALCLHLYYVHYLAAAINIAVNLVFISVLLFVCFLYACLKLKKTFINEVFGIGDLLLFVFLTFTFSSVSFITLMVFAMVFSLVAHLALKKRSSDKSVPLAGYISLFFAAIYLGSLFYKNNILYTN